MTNSNLCLYLFLDEGGNFDFSPSGTRYFSITSVAMTRPFLIQEPWDSYKYDLIEFGRDVEYFHCTDDNRHMRDKLFGILQQHANQLRIDSLIIDKPKTGPALRDDSRFYPEMLGHLLKHVFSKLNGYSEIIVITDTIPHEKKRKAIEKGIKHTLKAMLPADVKYTLLHHTSRAHYGLQVADYCNWAIFRKWQKGETLYYEHIKAAIHSEFDIFRTGRRGYY